MFNLVSNVPFNNSLLSGGTIGWMPEKPIHPSMQRLYQAARELQGLIGQSAVANCLVEAPQTLNNWETRGISQGGAIKAQAKIGCNVTWLLDGTGEMTLAPQDTSKKAATATPVTAAGMINASNWAPQALQAAVLVNMLKTDADRELVLEMINRVVLARSLPSPS